MQLAEIAKLAKITTGAIYRHFKNKEALFFTLIEEEYNYTIDVISDVEKKEWTSNIKIRLDLVNDEAIMKIVLKNNSICWLCMTILIILNLIFACSKGSQVENFIEDIYRKIYN